MQTVVNPLREGLTERRRPDPFTLVIFGAAGDLAHRKLFPALYNLMVDGWLPPDFRIVGIARRAYNNAEFRQEVATSVQSFSRRPPDLAVLNRLTGGLSYITADFKDPAAYEALKTLLTDPEGGFPPNYLFYLATPPQAYRVIAAAIGEAGLNRSPDPHGWVRIIVEKPFGHDLESALSLNHDLHQVFEEPQIYRIDHYLGKETVQNILVFRFANGIFEPLWNRQYIDHVQITVAESLGVEGRGSYYDQAGALRDMVQNHMLQLLSLIAMEPPVAFEADAVRDEKVKVLRSIRPFSTRDITQFTVRAQYETGSIDGEVVPGYLDEPDIASDSRTETYVALRLLIDNWRWAGVPFYLRTGKRLAKRATEIAIQFKRAPRQFFRQTETSELEPNQLTIKIQPDEGISLRFGAKVPGPAIRVRTVNMEFLYGTSFAGSPPEAYERLLLDAMVGDSTLFTRKDEVEEAWTLVTSILHGWERARGPLATYESGSWGPREADELIARDGFQWRRP
ncbi:glucose-6-phosphate 1-dehydrogenase [Sulfobacillus acidophilus TPY]|uniref:Glucose-6-phosphate 1-dehydrogenase n=1 Tax=Sulfobacillus acidophilus (strain ATCC 700253 / DSM 10332 / NAL) TaxID=679936 RepID=G8TWS2_SULAD|nr:glucose-6-phosphate 1-dehydrogenase [Sulfobacillus acidophilus TPY]AEW06061.1 glucose-6-phosphate 1-dehydrogenase [Sulfobacillus acidophilus DSM 10332]